MVETDRYYAPQSAAVCRIPTIAQKLGSEDTSQGYVNYEADQLRDTDHNLFLLSIMRKLACPRTLFQINGLNSGSFSFQVRLDTYLNKTKQKHLQILVSSFLVLILESL